MTESAKTPATVPNVVGVDLSLTATGIAWEGGERVIAPLTALPIEERVAFLHVRLLDVIAYADLVVVEDLPKNVRFAGPALGMAHGAFCMVMSVLNTIPVVRVPPASLKKFATGSGNAGKPEMVAAAIRRLGYGGHDNNEADALWLRAMGLDALGAPLTTVPAAQRAALDKVEWPAVVS